MIQHSHGVTNTIVIIGGFQFNAGIGRNGSRNQSHAFSIGRNRKGHGPVGISSLQSAGGQHQNLVGIGSGGVVGFAARDDDAVLTTFHNAHVQIGIHLLRGTLGSIALHVGLTGVTNQIVILIPRQILLEALVVVSAVVLIHLIGRDVQGINGIATHASLNAAASQMTQFPDHGLLFQQIVWRLIDMGKAVNSVAGKMRGCGS